MDNDILDDLAASSKKPRLRLTPEAQEVRNEFYYHYGDGNCSCHINPPCGSCTHEGNPRNQKEDDDAWQSNWEHDETGEETDTI